MSIYDNKLPFGLLRDDDPETYRALVEWRKAGKKVEVFTSRGWVPSPGRFHLEDSSTYRAVREPSTAEEVDRLRRKVAAGEKLALAHRHAITCGLFLPWAQEALREWEAADE